MEFYKILEEIMKEKGIKIKDIKKLTGIPDSTLRSIIERQQKNINLESAFKIARGLNIPIERLNGEKTNKLNITEEELKIIESYRELSAEGKEYINRDLEIAKELYKEKEEFLKESNNTRRA